MADRLALRLVVAVVALVLLVLAGRDLSQRVHRAELTLSECLVSDDASCLGRQFNLGGLRLKPDGALVEGVQSAVSSSDVAIELQGWPLGVPYPTAGVTFSVIAQHLGQQRFAVQKAELYPLNGMDMLVGVIVVLAWLASVLVAIRRRYWRQDLSEHG